MLPARFYIAAQKFRRWFRDETRSIFQDVDAFLAPATPATAPLIDQAMFELDGQELPVRANLGIFTQPLSFIGLPVVSVPLRATNGLPIGVQIVTSPGREDIALRLAAVLEAEGVTASGIGKDAG